VTTKFVLCTQLQSMLLYGSRAICNTTLTASLFNFKLQQFPSKPSQLSMITLRCIQSQGFQR